MKLKDLMFKTKNPKCTEKEEQELEDLHMILLRWFFFLFEVTEGKNLERTTWLYGLQNLLFLSLNISKDFFLKVFTYVYA